MGFLFSVASIAAVAAGASAACVVPADVEGLESLVAVANSVSDQPGISRILKALTSAKDRPDAKDITIFAPTDAAFEALEGEVIPDKEMAKIIRNHVIFDFFDTDYLLEGFEGQFPGNPVTLPLTSSIGKTLEVTKPLGSETFFVTPAGTDNTAEIIEEDVLVCSGVVHVIDRLLVPAKATPPCVKAEDVAGLGSLVVVANSVSDQPGMAEIIDALTASTQANEANSVTIFAPTDAAFEALEGEVISDADMAKMIRNSVVLDFHPIDYLFEGFEGQFPGNPVTLPLTSSLGTTLEVTKPLGSDTLFVTPAGTTATAEVIEEDVFVCSGVVHVVDKILAPMKKVKVVKSVAVSTGSNTKTTTSSNTQTAFEFKS